MAGKQIVDKIQLGNSGTPGNNFLISTLNDGTMKIQRGNDGGALTDVLTIDANGKPIFAWEIAAGQQSFGVNGYQKLANGLIIQWGVVTLTGGSAYTTVPLPIAYPAANYGVYGNALENVGGVSSEAVEFGLRGLSSFEVIVLSGVAANNSKINWYSIGR